MLFTLGALSLAYLGAAALLDWRGRRPPPDGATFDAIVVLGCRVLPDGRPSASLEGRARRAGELFHEGRAERIVLTGGVGDAPISEARAAAAVLEALGVPRDALVLEEVSTTTEENAREAAARVGPMRVLVVTDAYHVVRAARVFARHFPEVAATGSLGPPSARAKGALREVVALAAYAARGRL
ncbi:MAG: YdcF family protein [Sandaracinaceae bacterium]|nr:YdcF family protein [Sandaracinaceae bacterium]